MWRTLASETLIKDRWIDVRADRCITPSGAEISPYYVLTYPDWVHVVALTPDRGLVLVRQYRHAAGQWLLGLPAGVVDGGDDDVERSARRELAEESGFMSDRWRKVSALYPNPATHTNRAHTFVALDAVATQAPQLDEGEEGLEVIVRPIDEVLAGLEDGIFQQATHVSSLLLAMRSIDALR